MRRWLLGLAAVGLAGALGLVWAAGSALTAPAVRPVETPEDLGVEPASISSPSGELAAWVVPVDSARGVVVLMHGVRADRSSQIDRIRLFSGAGYHAVAFDFQAHGESPGDAIAFGWRERDDAIAAVQFARERFSDLPVAVVAQSMGGAAALLAGRQLDADALVVEAVYESLERATRNRLAMRLGRAGSIAAPLLTAQIRPRLGVSATQLRPAHAASQLDTPVFVLAGSDDEHAQPDEAESIYDAAPKPKALWIVEGAAHQDLYRFAPEAYRERVLAFLEQSIQE